MKLATTFIILLLTAFPALADIERFERTELNFDFKVNNELSFGIKQFHNHPDNHEWIRYKIKDTPYQFEYRRQTLNDQKLNNVRFQIKHYDNGFFYWSRFEYRERQRRDNQLRYRPRIGYKWQKYELIGQPYIFVEPHYVIDTKQIPLIMTYVGTKWKGKKVDYGIFVQTQSNDRYQPRRIWVGTEILIKF